VSLSGNQWGARIGYKSVPASRSFKGDGMSLMLSVLGVLNNSHSDSFSIMSATTNHSWENGYNERFNGTLRKEVLNAEWFHTTRQAQVAINVWLRQYNQIRPHHALNMRPPVPETLLEKPKINGRI
jgi:hypothetical protein